jgi:hypothetical protein
LSKWQLTNNKYKPKKKIGEIQTSLSSLVKASLPIIPLAVEIINGVPDPNLFVICITNN